MPASFKPEAEALSPSQRVSGREPPTCLDSPSRDSAVCRHLDQPCQMANLQFPH